MVKFNFYIRLVCLLTASIMATHALSQDMSGWSDKTVCRLLLSKPDAPAYIKESTTRGLKCDGVTKNIEEAYVWYRVTQCAGNHNVDSLVNCLNTKLIKTKRLRLSSRAKHIYSSALRYEGKVSYLA